MMQNKWYVILGGLAFSTVIVGLIVFVTILKRGNNSTLTATKQCFSPRPSIVIPPHDFAAWRAEFAINEPDPAFPEGIARLKEERQRLPQAIADYDRLIDLALNSCTNCLHDAMNTTLTRAEEILSGFSRENCEIILRTVNDVELGLKMQKLIDNSNAEDVIGAYYVLAGKLADWWWRYGGREFEAADFDYRTYCVLKNGKRDCSENSSAFDSYIKKWKIERCDNPDSNFARAHFEGERLFKLYYAEAVKADSAMLKPTISWYRIHLKLSRVILGREPSWVDDGNEK